MEMQPHYMNGSSQGISTVFYINGDDKFPGKKVLFNLKRNRNFTSCLDHLTDSLNPPFGAVRNIFTPEGGHRVDRFQEINPEGRYVAAGRVGFRKIRYTDIEKQSPRRQKNRNIFDISRKNPKFKDVPPKIHQMDMHAIKIYVWPNGETINPPHPISLLPSQREYMQDVIRYIDERMNSLTRGYITRIYSREGERISDPKTLRNNEYYVAVKQTDPFLNVNYAYKQRPNIMTSHHIHKWKELPPLNLSRGSKNSKGWSPDHSGHSSYQDSENSYSQRYRQHKHNRHSREPREEDEVFPRKPVSHKRSSERKHHREVDLDKDDGGVFKAKQGNRHTQGAREVRDTRDTKVDLPIDQVPAEEVKDERIRGKPNSDNQKHKNKDVKDIKGGNSLAGKNGYKQDRVPQSNAHKQQEKAKNQKNSNRDHRGMNGYDDRYDSPQRSPSPHQSPIPRYSSNKRNSPSPRRSPSPRYNNSQRSPDRNSLARSPDQNANWQEREDAAVKIQSHMKGYLTRKNLKENNDKGRKTDSRQSKNDDLLQREKEEAATKIQSHIRGYQARKNYAVKKAERDLSAGRKSVDRALSAERRSVDRVLSAGQRSTGRRSAGSQNDDYNEPASIDREKHAAATKIQAHFRGYQTRRDYEEKR